MLLAWLFCKDVPLSLTSVSAIHVSAVVLAYRNAAPALRIVVFVYSSEFLGAYRGFSSKLKLKPIARPVAAHAPKSGRAGFSLQLVAVSD